MSRESVSQSSYEQYVCTFDLPVTAHGSVLLLCDSIASLELSLVARLHLRKIDNCGLILKNIR
jgi:hypothetical protein